MWIGRLKRRGIFGNGQKMNARGFLDEKGGFFE
jgi:hypothetical protein